MTEQMPPPVEDRYRYWSEPPPALSPRCLWWLGQLNDRRWTVAELNAELPETIHGYDTTAELYGVYIWEWCNILWHVVAHTRYWTWRNVGSPPLDDLVGKLPEDAGSSGFSDPLNLPGIKRGTITIKGRAPEARDDLTDKLRREGEDQAAFYAFMGAPPEPGQCGAGMWDMYSGADLVCVEPAGHEDDHASRITPTMGNSPITWPRGKHDDD